jgi:cardiolipin-specific phospholipase
MDNETREYIDSSLDHQAQQQRQNPRRPGISSAPTEFSMTNRPGVGREESTQSVAPTDFEADKEAKRGNHGWWKKAVYYMWEGGVSPFGLVRKLGPVGPMLVAKYSTRRFAALPEEDIADLHDYVWT